MKKYHEESNKGYVFEVDVQYVKKLDDLHNDLPFLLQRLKNEQVEKVVANLHDKTEHVMHIRNLKQALIMDQFWKKFIKWLNLLKMLC